MNTRKLAAALAAAGVATVGLGTAVRPAEAVPRTFQVTLLTGVKITVTVDLPPGQAPSASSLGIPGVATITEITPPAPAPAPEPAPAPQPAPQPEQPQQQPEQQAQPDAPTATTPQDEPKPRDKSSKGTPQKSTGGSALDAVEDAADAALDGAAGTAKKDHDGHDHGDDDADAPTGNRLREPDGAPAVTNPGLSLAEPGAAPIGVPNFFIDKFRIPPFLLSIYQAAGVEYGIRWEVLAAINEIETDYGRNLNVSSAGALGWMQFMPATWKQYGTDANGDKKKDPYNPVDAIFAAARYLKAAGAEQDLRKAIFAYNHADWYVDSVLMRARIIGGLPTDLVGSLTGLTQGIFPVHAKSRYADDISEEEANKRIAKGKNAALPVEATNRRGIKIYADAGAPAVAVQDGKIVNMGRTKRLGKFIKLRDAFGNTYTYAHLDEVADRYPVPKEEEVTEAEVRRELKLPKDPKPEQAASAGKQVEDAKAALEATPTKITEGAKERLFAQPNRPEAFKNGGEDQIIGADGVEGSLKDYVIEDFGLSAEDVTLKRLRVGSKVIGGTILGRIGETAGTSSAHMLFEIRPAGRGAPRIDPKPILDGWKLLETTAIYRAKGKNPFFGRDAANPSVGQILLMGKSELQKRVLNNPRIEIYEVGRRDIEASRIDRRVLASLEFLAASGLRPTVSSLAGGRSSLYTASGNLSAHPSGNAVDIAKINGVPIIGNQGKGSVTDITVQRLLTLQGTMKPAQIITLMKYDGHDNTLAMADHDDHIHVGYRPDYGPNTMAGRQLNAVLKPGQWIKLIDRLGKIDNPAVNAKPSKYALPVKPARASRAHKGE